MSTKVTLEDRCNQFPLPIINALLGIYQYIFSPLDISNSSVIFRQVMNNRRRNVDGVEVYLDDVIMDFLSETIHDALILKLFRRF